ncbi:MAG: hypothetical protein SFU85_04615 [Candidatus Methylacidiphilales bacterium]|nr:hypothetical protein [Candidatus Methylacidiphilales bacterium]
MPNFSVYLGLVTLILSAFPAQGQSMRDPEALYLEGVPGLSPIILKVLGPTPVYATRSLSAHVGNLVEGDEVRLVAHHPESFFVRLQKGKMEGWVDPKFIQPPPSEMIEQARAIVEQESVFQASIKKKEVLPGMTFDHVQKALGKPDTRTFRVDDSGRIDVWSFVDYETVIEQRPYRDPLTGQVFYQSVRVKIPVGSLEVEFKEGHVNAVERQRDTRIPRITNRLR